MKRGRFLTDKENAAIESMIYNDKPLVLDEFKEVEDSLEESFLDRVLLKGEIAVEIEQEDYAITSMGRLFNVRYKRQLRPILYPHHISVILRAHHVQFDRVLRHNGMDISHEEIIENYKNNNWSFVLPILYRNNKIHNKLYKPFK